MIVRVFKEPRQAPRGRLHAPVWVLIPCFALVQLLTGCGAGSHPGTAPSAPTNLTYSQTTISATVGTAIPADLPTVSGTVSSYSVTPALPVGLTLSSSTGVISGTPGAASSTANYTVTASNPAGSTTATVVIAISVAPPSNLVYPQTSISATAGVAIQADTPTVTGTVNGYTISPALPAGLAITLSTGTISGTPTSPTQQASYTVTATNSAGSATATVAITVLVAPPSNLVYPQANISATVGAAIQADIPTVIGAVSGYAISPALPAGLSIDSSTGTISGTPVGPNPQTTYTITAMNAAGSTTGMISIAIASNGKQLLDLGHVVDIYTIRISGDRVLTEDASGHWNLWDYTSGHIVTSGDGAQTGDLAATLSPPDPHEIDLAGQLAVVATSAAVQVYQSSDGSQLFTVPGAAWFKLATDGSYVCTGSSSGITVWSPSGNPEFTLPGDYSEANAFALPNQVEIALGPAGASVIETDSVPSGATSLSGSFSGTFNSWFLDGQKFLTNLSSAVWVYSNSGVQLGIMNVPSTFVLTNNLTGQGNWVWANSGTALQVYAIGAASPAASYPLPNATPYYLVPSGTSVAILQWGPPTASLIDLSGSAPVQTTFPLPSPTTMLRAFAYASSSEWIVGNQTGVLLDGATATSTPRYFGFGEATSIAGSSSNMAIATASGQILLFDPTGASLLGTIAFLSGKVALSSDGSVLGASAFARFDAYLPDRSLNIYSLPAGTLAYNFPYTFSNTPYMVDFSLSGSGQTLGQLFESGSAPIYSRQVSGISGSPVIWTDTGQNASVVLSPDGTKVAAPSGAAFSSPTAPTTEIYNNGALAAAVSGLGEGWIDNDHLLVGNYQIDPYGAATFMGSTIYDSTGVAVSTLPASGPPSVTDADFPSTSLVYVQQANGNNSQSNAVYSLTGGAMVWQGPGEGPGAIAGANVVYVSGHQVSIAPY